MADNAALLIDADNLSPEAMARALAQLQGRGLQVCVRRAYGSHETLAQIRDFLQSNGVRALVNQGKGTTDAALVVDAMDMLHAGMLPRVVAIGSGDSDFAPLVVRLREAGRKLVCLAQRHKAADGLDRYYDEVVHLDEPAPAPRPAAKKAAAAKAPAAKAPAAKKAPAVRKAAAAKKAPAAPQPDPVHAILQAFPGFDEGREVELGPVVKKLRDEKLMGKTTSAGNFFKKHAPDVELLPPRQPHKLRRVAA